MKVIIAGSRSITNYQHVYQAWLNSKFDLTEIVSGGARGVDSLGEELAKELDIPVKRFIPHWREYGKKAGILRNVEMAEYADALIAVWDGRSKGTAHMIAHFAKTKKPFYIEKVHKEKNAS